MASAGSMMSFRATALYFLDQPTLWRAWLRPEFFGATKH